MKKYILTLLCFCLLSSISFSQKTGTIRGTVYEKENGEPAFGTNVKIKGTGIGASSDINGYYQISKVQEGSYTLEVSSVEFKNIEFDVTVKAGRIVTKNFFMEENSEILTEFEVNAEAQERKTDVKMSVIKATPKDILI